MKEIEKERNDKFYIAPELKITKRLSLLDVMKTDVAQVNKSNELILRYTPKAAQTLLA